MKKLITFLLLLVSIISVGQGTLVFGTSSVEAARVKLKGNPNNYTLTKVDTTFKIVGLTNTYDIKFGDGESIATRTLTLNPGTGVNITGGTQTLEANRSWTISIPQSVSTSASPTFVGVTLSGLSNGVLKSTSGVVSSSSIVNADISTSAAIDYTKITGLTVDNIAALKLKVGTYNGQLASVLGYYNYADGGEGNFYWNSTSTATDNGGTAIQVTGVSTGRWIRIFNGNVKIKWFGAKGDFVTNDATRIQAAANLMLPLEFDGSKYNLGTTSILIYNNVVGNKSTLKGRTILTIEKDSVKIENLNFEGNNVYVTPNSGTVADVAVTTFNHSNITISNCRLKNTRVTIRNNQLSEQKNFTLINCKFDTDFSNFDYVVTQNDVVSIRGINGVWIENNEFIIKNVHRVLKFADTEIASDTLITPYRCQNVFITNNVIKGTTTSLKQVADFFTGTSDVYIDKNNIKVKGFTWVFENKTGSIADFNQNFNVTNNILQNTNTILNFQGSYGATRAGFNVGNQNVKITGNTIIRDSTTTERLLEIRYYDNVIVTDNEFIAPVEMVSGVGASSVNFFSNANIIFNNNVVTNGCVYFTNSTSNSANGGPFSSPALSIKCNNNKILNFGGTAFLGGFYISSVNWPNCIVDISNNTIKQLIDDAGSSGVIALNSATLSKLVVTGNVSAMASSSEERLRVISSTIAKTQEESNSWNLISKTNATYDPANLAQYATATTTITATGAAFGDNVDVSFTRGLSTVMLTAWVSSANTVTVQFYNIGASAVDLASGTIAVKVKRYTL